MQETDKRLLPRSLHAAYGYPGSSRRLILPSEQPFHSEMVIYLVMKYWTFRFPQPTSAVLRVTILTESPPSPVCCHVRYLCLHASASVSWEAFWWYSVVSCIHGFPGHSTELMTFHTHPWAPAGRGHLPPLQSTGKCTHDIVMVVPWCILDAAIKLNMFSIFY